MSRKSKTRKIDRDVFGGQTLRNGDRLAGGTHAKKKRPISRGDWLHVCMRSKIAVGRHSMLRAGAKRDIRNIVQKAAIRFQIRISSWQNVGNHLHFSVKSPDRFAYNAWIRTISGLIARAVLRTDRGTPSRSKFWDSRPFTRVVRGFEAFDRLALYIKKNQLEAAGLSTSRAKEIVHMIALKQMYLDQVEPIDISNPPPD